MNLVDLMNLGWLGEPGLTFFGTAYVGGSTSPFIDEGDGLTSERERVCMFLSLVAYDGEYRTTINAHNTVDITVECQMHVGGL